MERRESEACPAWTELLDFEVHPAQLEESEKRETVVFKVNTILCMIDHLISYRFCDQVFLEHLEEMACLELKVAREREVSSVLREIKVCLDQSAFKERRVTKASPDQMA